MYSSCLSLYIVRPRPRWKKDIQYGNLNTSETSTGYLLLFKILLMVYKALNGLSRISCSQCIIYLVLNSPKAIYWCSCLSIVDLVCMCVSIYVYKCTFLLIANHWLKNKIFYLDFIYLGRAPKYNLCMENTVIDYYCWCIHI